MTLTAGTDFGSYHLIRHLGQGGFAEVWEAESRTTGRRVALKVLTQLPTSSSNALERFRQEGRLAAGLHHPRCVYVFDAGEVNGVPYISMELMPGGTLADRVRGGPLSVAQAVDYVIDMLDGLEAAHAAGIIHRDIKPSNVFLDEQGRARLGDFGISKSLENTTALSVTGGFLGTPQYASPEQAGGEAVDARSDLYSAGTVLYELLTGESPYKAENPAQALARVLTQAPPPFPARAAVPLRLQRVVYRLLAKQKEKRFQSSAAAREALTPYSSRGVTTAELARRFGAIAIDLVIFAFVGVALGGFSFRHQLASQIVQLALLLLYFVILEGLGGMSVGKRLVGLRVVTPAGGAPAFGRVVVRSLLFVLLYLGSSLAFSLFNFTPAPLLVFGALASAVLVLVSTMRPSNGFAALHEVVSRTRTVAVRRLDRAALVPEDPPAVSGVPVPAPSFGPYTPTGVIWTAQGRAVYVAHDDELRRDVWIHLVPAGERARLPSTDELRARSAGYLPWLQRGESGGSVWDAYGAPRGVLLERWAARGPIKWATLRRVLLSLGQTIAQSQPRGGASDLSTSRVWIDRTGLAQLLDFPLEPGPPEDSAHTRSEVGGSPFRVSPPEDTARTRSDVGGSPFRVSPPDDTAHTRSEVGGSPFRVSSPEDSAQTRSEVGGSPFRVSPPNWQEFLQQVTALGLTGRSGDAPAPPRLPLPVHARQQLARLWGEGTAFAGVSDFVTAFEHDQWRPAAIPRARRAATLLIPAVWPTLILLVTLIQSGSQYPAWFRDLIQDRPFYMKGLHDSVATPQAKAAIEVVLASGITTAEATPRLGQQMLGFMPAADRALLDSVARRHPGVTLAQADTARRWLRANPAAWIAPGDLRKVGMVGQVTVGVIQIGMFGIAAVILALVLRGPPLLHLAGISVSRADGSPAGRVRCALRSAAAWGPLIALLLLHRAPFAVQIGLALLGLAGAAYAMANPDRGIADRVMKTVLVPK